MSVGPAEAERIDADHDRTFGKRFAGRLHLHGTPVEVDLRIRHEKILGDRRERAALHHQDDLEQGAVKRGGFHMPDVALDAGHPQRNLAVDTAERLRDGVPFDAITHHGPGRMSFDVIKILCRAVGAGAGDSHQLHL